MKTLKEHNSDAVIKWSVKKDETRLNGISCPNCGEELYDSRITITLTSNPPQKNIHCESCDYIGFRIV